MPESPEKCIIDNLQIRSEILIRLVCDKRHGQNSPRYHLSPSEIWLCIWSEFSRSPAPARYVSVPPITDSLRGSRTPASVSGMAFKWNSLIRALQNLRIWTGVLLLRADLQAAVEESPSPDTGQTLFTGF